MRGLLVSFACFSAVALGMLAMAIPIAAQNPDLPTLMVFMKDEQFLKQEDAETPLDVLEVRVGQKVLWVNKENERHTATSTMNKADGKPLFDTGTIQRKGVPGDQKEVTFSADLYKAAGGTPGGGAVTIDYVCLYHKPDMKSSIRLKP
jgi:plastocyanin